MEGDQSEFMASYMDWFDQNLAVTLHHCGLQKMRAKCSLVKAVWAVCTGAMLMIDYVLFVHVFG